MNWGVIGYGEIAPSFIAGLMAHPKAHLKGIASRSSWEYLTKKKLYNDTDIYNNYEELLSDCNIEIVYICTTNNLHFENVATALKAKKHVLCEKPMSPSLKDTSKLCELAKQNDVFLLEGMWTRFLPAYRQAMKFLNNGIIGKPKLLKADFGFISNWPKHRRLLNSNLYGGTLLDNADYNIFLSQDVFKNYPIEINAQATFTETGVENSCSILLKYPGNGMAQLFSSFECETQQEAIIYGESGFIKLEQYWHGTNILIKTGGRTQSMQYPFKANGFEYEVEAVENAISQSQLECSLVTHEMSKEVATIIDDIKILIQKHA